jgi:hypothetical protein
VATARMFGQPGPYGISDAARRAADVVNLALLLDQEGNRGRWVAIRLSDGGSDGVIYDDPRAAADYQLHWKTCMYIPIPWTGMQTREAEIMLQYWRKCYDNGTTPPVLDGYVPVIPSSLPGVTHV